MQTLVKMLQNNPNKQILSPAKSAGCDANRVRGRRAKFGRYMLLDPNENFKFLVINPAQ